jgi:hypothetical protein
MVFWGVHAKQYTKKYPRADNFKLVDHKYSDHLTVQHWNANASWRKTFNGICKSKG